MNMFIERIWDDGKVELINMDTGAMLRMHEGYSSCWFLDVEIGGKVNTLLKNTSITIIHQQYQAIKDKWVGDKTVVVVG